MSEGTMTVRPQGGGIGMASEQQRVVAEIQAALTVAAARPRDEVRAIDKIKTACQRPRLAEAAEYSYSRGGQEISGPTIDLLTIIANCWGNVQFGFRELSQTNGESLVEAFAWDLETNSQRKVQFSVPHVRVSDRGKSRTVLTDPRDIYEHVANFAQRRVRKCLEDVIPVDVVEDALEECRTTLRESDPVTPERIQAMADAFEKSFRVTRPMLEERLGRRLDTIAPAQMASMKRIFKSLKDGMSKPEDWFRQEQAPEAETPAPKTAKDRLREKAKQHQAAQTEATPVAAEQTPGEPAVEETQPPAAPPADPQPPADHVAEALKRLEACKAAADVGAVRDYFTHPDSEVTTTPEQREEINRLCRERENALLDGSAKAPPAKKKSAKEF